MHGLVKYSGIMVMSLTMMLGLGACGGSSENDEQEVIITEEGKILFESDLQYVSVVERDMVGEANRHPHSISPDDLRAVLSSLYINQRVLLSERQIPLFSPGELQILASTVPRGLGMAESDEDITYVTLGVHQGTIANERRSNTGRMFIDGQGRLNIIFGLVHEDYRDKDQYTGQEIDRRVNPLKPGSRSFDSEPGKQVALDNGMSYYTDPDTGEERSDWLIINIPTVLATAQERAGEATDGVVSPQLMDEIARNSRDNETLKEDMSNIKEILFEMSAEIDALREDLKSQ